MIRRYIIIINILLFVLCLFLMNRIFEIWKPTQSVDDRQLKTKSQNIIPIPKFKASPKPARNAYHVIINKDLFRPDRSEWESASDTTPGKKPVDSPKITLLGIVISKDFKYAWIKEAVKKLKRKDTKARRVSEGDSIDNWKVIKIEPDSIRLSSGAETFDCRLIEPGKPKLRKLPRRSVPKNKKTHRKITPRSPNKSSRSQPRKMP